MTALGTLALAATLTVNLPKAFPVWLSWPAVIGRALRLAAPVYVLLLISGLFVVYGLYLTFFGYRRAQQELRAGTPSDPALDQVVARPLSLSITAEVLDPEHIGPRRIGGRSAKRYALLRVKNTGHQPIPNLVAELVYASSDPRAEPRARLAHQGEERLLIRKAFAGYGLWSKSPGEEYVASTDVEATINPGSVRYLLVANGRMVNIQSGRSSDRDKPGAVIWTGLRGSDVDPMAPALLGSTVRGDGVLERFQELHLGESAEVAVTFKSALGEIKKRYALGIERDKSNPFFGMAATLREVPMPSPPP